MVIHKNTQINQALVINLKLQWCHICLLFDESLVYAQSLHLLRELTNLAIQLSLLIIHSLKQLNLMLECELLHCIISTV